MNSASALNQVITMIQKSEILGLKPIRSGATFVQATVEVTANVDVVLTVELCFNSKQARTADSAVPIHLRVRVATPALHDDAEVVLAVVSAAMHVTTLAVRIENYFRDQNIWLTHAAPDLN